MIRHAGTMPLGEVEKLKRQLASESRAHFEAVKRAEKAEAETRSLGLVIERLRSEVAALKSGGRNAG